jgi:hypothetical protein
LPDSEEENEGFGVDNTFCVNNGQDGSETRSENSEISMVKAKKIMKSKEDAIPLPNPFPLPNSYGAEVDTALKVKQMTTITRQGFTAKVAAAILCYKRYPTPDDYTNVGYTIIKKYPFMKAPLAASFLCSTCHD